MLEFMRLQKPEWQWLLLGFIGCFAVGVDVPISSFFIGELTRVSTFLIAGLTLLALKYEISNTRLVFSEQVFALSGQALIEASRSWSLTYSILSVFAGFAYYMQVCLN